MLQSLPKRSELKAIARIFDNVSESLPRKAEHLVPKQVRYPTWCRNACTQCSSTELVEYIGKRTTCFERLAGAAPKNKPSNMAAADLYVAIARSGALAMHDVIIRHMCETSGSSGITAASQRIYDVHGGIAGANGSSWPNRIIQCRYEPWLEPYVPMAKPFNVCDVGPPRSMSGVDLATELLRGLEAITTGVAWCVRDILVLVGVLTHWSCNQSGKQLPLRQLLHQIRLQKRKPAKSTSMTPPPDPADFLWRWAKANAAQCTAETSFISHDDPCDEMGEPLETTLGRILEEAG